MFEMESMNIMVGFTMSRKLQMLVSGALVRARPRHMRFVKRLNLGRKERVFIIS